MGRRYANILETIGNTPVVRINKLAPTRREPFRQDRGVQSARLGEGPPGARRHRGGRKSGELKPGQTVIEATCGNTGIGLAMVCAAKGYPLVVTMAETFGRTPQTDALSWRQGGVDARLRAGVRHGRQDEGACSETRLVHDPPVRERGKPDFHSRTTAREIIDDFKDIQLDYWVTGYGTGGTLKGVSRVLAKELPNTKIVVCEPTDASMLSSGEGQQRNPDGTPAGGHTAWKPHPMQGWAPDFIPKLTADVVESGAINKILRVAGPDALRCSRELAQKEGIFVGITAGGTLAGALQVCAEAPKGANILAMLPDTGERYLSTPLFADIAVDMTEEEVAISKSTPGCQMPS